MADPDTPEAREALAQPDMLIAFAARLRGRFISMVWERDENERFAQALEAGAAALRVHPPQPSAAWQPDCNICRKHTHAKWHDVSKGEIINPIALLEFLDAMPDSPARFTTTRWVSYITGIEWPLPPAPPPTGEAT